ncbi:hypothetical protein [Acinetobacter bereziniae]|uniref:hypothetical protein n=1 Tax=Acinetobacter bereziniae TaxID=106648 RepID=UPI000EF65545|nr:hypothetical protein [Acinetobacter bereziniae]
MDKCREAFEKQKHLTIYISNLVFDEKDNRYIPNEKRIRTFEEWEWKAFSNQAYAVNLAWWAWQSRQAEVNQLQSQINEMAEVGLSQGSAIREKDKGIESALSELESLHNTKWAEWKEQADMHSQGEANAYEHAMQILEKALRGEHE